jgi:hypothetical protein
VFFVVILTSSAAKGTGTPYFGIAPNANAASFLFARAGN